MMGLGEYDGITTEFFVVEEEFLAIVPRMDK